MNEMSKKDALLASVVIFLWGINFYFIKLSLNEISPMVLGFLRFVFLLLPAIFIIKKPAVQWHWLALYGLTMSFGQFALLFSAISVGMPTGLAALIHQAQAFFTVIIAFVFWREPLKANHLIAMSLAGVGLGLVGVGQYQGQLPMLGVVLMLFAALVWAVGNVLVKKSAQSMPCLWWSGTMWLRCFCLV